MTKKQHKAWRKCRVAQALHRRKSIENIRGMLLKSIYPVRYSKGEQLIGSKLGQYKAKLAAGAKKADLNAIKRNWKKKLERIHEHIQLEMLEIIP